MPGDVEELEGVEEEDKKKKKKKDKKDKGGFDATVSDEGAMYTDAEEDEGGSLSVVLITVFIVIIWLAILCLLIKLDVGGFGSDILYPVLKDVPVVNKILPEADYEDTDDIGDEFRTLNEALAEIQRLRAENNQLKKSAGDSSQLSAEEISSLKNEIIRLRTFEDSQIEFQKLKTEFYEEVVFSEQAPTIDEYKKYYESIDPENAEYLYKQVVTQIEEDAQMAEYVKTYTEMKPKAAAAVFEEMTDRLDLVAAILGQMDPSSRAKILNVMDKDVASQLTKIMDPE